MALPRLDSAKYELTVPSTGEKILYRPYLVKEEKILMLAMESEDTSQMVRAVKDVIRACTDDAVDTRNITMFDMEYIFVQLRAKSSGETADVGIKCSECGKKNDVTIDLQSIYVDNLENKKKTVKLTDTIHIEMKYPNLDTITKIESEEGISDLDKVFKLIISSIDTIYSGEESFSASEQSEKELIDFVDQMNGRQFESIRNFVENMPQTKIDVTFTCAHCEHENTMNVRGLSNFFN